MTTLAAANHAPRPAPTRLQTTLRSPWLWCLLAVTYFALFGIGYSGGRLHIDLGDTDDATRLLQLRKFVAGAGWFDLTLERLGGTRPLVSHWSRLIDFPLAGLIKVISMFTTAERSELLARAVWPIIVLCGLLRVLAHEAERRAGLRAAGIAVFLGATSLSALYQFAAGRIDHHNVMILLTVAGLLCLARGLDVPRLGFVAGSALGFALVIGYEPLALIVPTAGLAAVAAAIYRPWTQTVRNLVLAMTAVLVAGLIISQPPSAWLAPVCDAVSLNLIVLAGAGAVGLVIVFNYGTTWTPVRRLAVLVASGIAGIMAYLALNPSCLAGPYGAMSADAKHLWLSGVIETQPLWETVALFPLLGLVFIVFAGMAAAAAIARARSTPTAEAFATLIALGLAIISATLQMKFIPYATSLAVVVLAVSIANLQGNENVSPRAALMMGMIVTNQLLLSMLLLPLADKLETRNDPATDAGRTARSACRAIPAMQSLNVAPKGLIAAHVDLGPHIAASSHHDALAAPYHRIDRAIVEAHRIFTSEPAETEQRLRKAGVSYVLHCFAPADPGKPVHLGSDVTQSSLQGRLTRGDTMPFLEKMTLASPTPNLHLWRVLPPR